MYKIKIALFVALIAVAGLAVYRDNHNPKVTNPKTAPKPAIVNYCADNSVGQVVIVSIARQHMWACDSTKTVYDSAVITGMQMYPNDLTPPGTYKVYDKLTDQVLTGSDQFTSWRDPVSYWMPFLSNQYGVYGFHDATWRSDSDFGKVDTKAPFTTVAKSGSHGCVEMPLAAMKWLYGWAPVGTSVTINS